jgi:nickel-dependent lactate racemase
MPDAIELFVGLQPWTLTVPGDHRIELKRAAIVPTTQSPAELVRDALEHPHEFEAMRRALTPDDHVTIVLDTNLPHVAALLVEVLDHLRSGGVQLDAVTVLTAPGSRQDWIDELPDDHADVRTEIHDPTDRRKLAYLATTSGGRRVYLNRTLVDADFVVVLSGRDFDPHTGYAGAEASIFPALSDEETRESFAGEFSTDAPTAGPDDEPWPARAEASEILWLLGTPFLVQVIGGVGDSVQSVVAGLPPSSAEGIVRQNARWSATAAREPDTVIVSLAGQPERLTFLDLAKAAACSARVVKKGGRIAILTTAAPDLGAGAQLLRKMEGPAGARKLLAKEKPDDWTACRLWVFAAKRHSLYLASGYPDTVAEELFTRPIRTASEVQRLIDASENVLVIPDAHKMMVTFDDK